MGNVWYVSDIHKILSKVYVYPQNYFIWIASCVRKPKHHRIGFLIGSLQEK